MKIYTSYFAKIKNMPENIIPITICGQAPKGYNGKQFRVLAPTYDIFKQYKQTGDSELYTQRFYNERLNKLNALDIYKRLEILSEGKDIALICYEKPSDFCHRHLVADWLNKELNINVEEFKER